MEMSLEDLVVYGRELIKRETFLIFLQSLLKGPNVDQRFWVTKAIFSPRNHRGEHGEENEMQINYAKIQ